MPSLDLRLRLPDPGSDEKGRGGRGKKRMRHERQGNHSEGGSSWSSSGGDAEIAREGGERDDRTMSGSRTKERMPEYMEIWYYEKRVYRGGRGTWGGAGLDADRRGEGGGLLAQLQHALSNPQNALVPRQGLEGGEGGERGRVWWSIHHRDLSEVQGNEWAFEGLRGDPAPLVWR